MLEPGTSAMGHRCRRRYLFTLDYVVYDFSFASLFSGKGDTVMIVRDGMREWSKKKKKKKRKKAVP